MKTEFTMPDFTYFPILSLGIKTPLFILPETDLALCGKLQAIEWVQEHEDSLVAIYCHEAGRFFDASSEIAKEWLDSYVHAYDGAQKRFDQYPAFIQNHAGKELEQAIQQYRDEVKEGEAYLKEIAFQFDTSRGCS